MMELIFLAYVVSADNLLFIMGGNISGSTEFNYRTKTGIPITYIFYDLKGKNRFTGEPNN